MKKANSYDAFAREKGLILQREAQPRKRFRAYDLTNSPTETGRTIVTNLTTREGLYHLRIYFVAINPDSGLFTSWRNLRRIGPFSLVRVGGPGRRSR